MMRIILLAYAVVASFAFIGCEINDCPWGDDHWFDDDWFDDDDDDDWDYRGCSDGDSCPVLCAPGSVRYCEAPAYCSTWGEQVCLPDGSGWGPCEETLEPMDCSHEYETECCVIAGGCCEDVDDLDDDGEEGDSVGACEDQPEPEPEPEPTCPDGSCGCSSDDECDSGLLCIDALCTDIDDVCVFDFECGPEAVCIDNDCHQLCDCECPVGQSCDSGVCFDSTGGGCVFDEDCGEPDAALCIDGTCHSACSSDEDCIGAAEACLSGACRVDTSPLRECASNDDCDEALTCQRGICRLPCVADINCLEPMTCGEEGLCVYPSENDLECLRASDCSGEAEACRDGRCG